MLPISPALQPLGTPNLLSVSYRLASSGHFIQIEPTTMWPLGSDFHAVCFQGSPLLKHVSELPSFFFFNTEILAYHSFLPFRTFHSVGFSTVTELCNHHHTIVLEQFHYPKRNPVSIIPGPRAQSPTFCLWGFAFSKHLNQQNHATCGRLCLAAPSLYTVFKVHPHCSMDQCFLPFPG